MLEGRSEGDLTENPRKTQNCGEQRLPAESVLVLVALCAVLGWAGYDWAGWASQAGLSCRAGYDGEVRGGWGDIYITEGLS